MQLKVDKNVPYITIPCQQDQYEAGYHFTTTSVCGEASVYMVLSGAGRSTGGREKGHCSGCLHITELQDMGDESTS